MEERAPYGPTGVPRNLATELATWLREQHWTANVTAHPTMHVVEATWLSAQHERFELTYRWQSGPVPEATCRFQVLSYGRLPELLFAAQHVRRLRDARKLVANCVRYANARLLARGILLDL